MGRQSITSGDVTNSDVTNSVDSRSLLLVDDSYAFRERLARAFRDRGLEVRAAANYDEAMALAREESPELAVVDLRMPGRSGLELLRDLKELDPSISVVVLSGSEHFFASINCREWSG